MILVTGATGQLGAAAARHLLKKPAAGQIAIFARDEAKAKQWNDKGAEVRFGDFGDPGSLNRAMQGVEKLFLVPPPGPEQRLQLQRNVLNAAKKAGVKHLVFASMAIRDTDTSVLKNFMEDYTQFEQDIKDSGISYTILRNTLYTDGIALFAGEKVFETGIFLPAGKGKVAFALRREMGEAAANVLLQAGHENKTYTITGNTLHSYEEVASILSALSGKNVVYKAADPAAFPDQLKSFGLPDIVVFVVSGISTDIAKGQYETRTADLENLLGRKPASLREGLKEIYQL